MKIALAQINPIIGSLKYNCQKMIHFIEEAKKSGAELVLFPELSLTGYPPEDLLLMPSFTEAVEESLNTMLSHSETIAVIVGTVRKNLSGGEKNLFNSAALLYQGQIEFYDKTLLPDYDVFSERRYFEPGTLPKVWNLFNKKIAITICEDLWHHAGLVTYSTYSRDPVEELLPQKPDILINISASPYSVGRQATRLKVCQKTAQTLNCPVLLCNQVGGNDSLIFDGSSLCVNPEGKVVRQAKGFLEELIYFESEIDYPAIHIKSDSTEDLFSALTLGVHDYFSKLGWQKALLGLSGGIDSAVASVIAVSALGKENVLALSLPSRYSSAEGRYDAKKMAERLGIHFSEISIEPIFESYLDTLHPFFKDEAIDVTEENLQARIRGTLLMAFSNKFGYLLLSTGNKSEMAMGYSTLYGDMCGGLAVLSDVTKNQVYALASLINREGEVIPQSIIDRAPSAELKLNQKDSDFLPAYPIVDVVLKDYVEDHLSIEEIAKRRDVDLQLVKDLVRKIHHNEYKRRQAPPGLRVTQKAFSAGRRFPIVQHWNVY